MQCNWNWLIGFAFFILFLPWAVFAQGSESFVVSVFGGVDNEAPSTPTLLTADPVTPTQINLSWSAATDNYAVDGYIVRRDGVQIATTTQLTYADSGLMAETLYSYDVQAFDAFFNYSSTSNSIATTTPAVPVVVPPVESETESVESTAARAVADEITITTGLTTAQFDITMARPSSLQLRWGRTASYELGYVVSDVFVKEHNIPLTDLSPRTTYEYELIGFTPYGPGVVLKRGTFTTDGEVLQYQPSNVTRFSAVGVGDDVVLSWQLPAAIPDVAYVRVLRSHLGFPAHLQDGAVVYQGSDSEVSMRDEGILSQYSPVYYTAFVVTNDGQVSSGAIAMVFANNYPDNNSDGFGDTTGVPVLNTNPVLVPYATSTQNPDRLTEHTRIPQLTDITLTQARHVGDSEYTFADESIELVGSEQFIVSVAKTLVSQNIKSIIASVVDPTDTRRQYQYLLRLNQAGTAYEATIPPLFVAGKSQVSVVVYDYEAFVVSQYIAPVTFIEASEQNLVVFPDMLYRYACKIIAIIFVVLVLLLLLVWRRRRHSD